MFSARPMLAALPLVLALALTGCGGGDNEDEGKEAEPTSEASPSESPVDEDLTEPGAELELGEEAEFAWQPREGLSGVAAVSVDKLTEVPIKTFSGFQLNAEMRRSTPYYVDITVENTGNTDLAGTLPPLYLDNGTDVLHPPADITSAFRPCPSRPLPKGFTAGKTAKLCLVFLAPEDTALSAIVLRPSEQLEPITWTGTVTTPKPARKPAPKTPASPPAG